MAVDELPQAGQNEYRAYLEHVENCKECRDEPVRCGQGERLYRAYRTARGSARQ